MIEKTCPTCRECGVIAGKMVCLATGSGRGFGWSDCLTYLCHTERDLRCKSCQELMVPYTKNIYLGDLNITKSVMICDRCKTMHIESPKRLQDPRD